MGRGEGKGRGVEVDLKVISPSRFLGVTTDPHVLLKT